MSAEDIALLTQADVAKLLKVTTRTVRAVVEDTTGGRR